MVRRPSSETPSEPTFDCSSERTWPSTDHDTHTHNIYEELKKRLGRFGSTSILINLVNFFILATCLIWYTDRPVQQSGGSALRPTSNHFGHVHKAGGRRWPNRFKLKGTVYEHQHTPQRQHISWQHISCVPPVACDDIYVLLCLYVFHGPWFRLFKQIFFLQVFCTQVIAV